VNPYHPTSSRPNRFAGTTRWLLFGAGAFLLFAILIFGGMEVHLLRADSSLTHSTTGDFIKGTFYTTGLHVVAGSDGEVQLLPIGFTDSWQTENAPTPLDPRAFLAAVSYNNILYAIGGYDSITGYKSTIYSATTSITGAITAGWSLAGDLGVMRAGHSAVISPTASGGILYVIGGFDLLNEASGFNTILYKTMNSSGQIAAGNWQIKTMPSTLKFTAAVVRNGYLYVIGGVTSGTTMNTIYRFPITNAAGDLGAPTTYVMPNALEQHAAVTWQSQSNVGYLYILGGVSDIMPTSIVNYVAFNPDGSLPAPAAWVTRTLVDAFSAHGGVQFNSNIHVIGGAKGLAASDYVSQVQSALIDFSPVEGELHDWSGTGLHWIVTSPLAEPRAHHGTAINTTGYVYVIGGLDATASTRSTVYRGTTSGAAYLHAPYGSYTNHFDTGSINNTLTYLRWTAWMTAAHTLTMRYRTSDSATNWPSVWESATASISGSNVITLPANLTKRYLQYQLLFTTTISSTTPLLRDVQLDYRPPPTPTPTNTSVSPTSPVTITTTPVPPGARLPDFMIPDMQAPVAGGSTMSYTLNISVTNWGTIGFNKLPQTLKLSKTAKVGQQTSRPGEKRRIPDSIRASAEYTGTTNYFVYLDAYVDPSSVPTTPANLGNCPAQGGGTNYAWIYALGLGETVNVPLQCYITAGAHTFYAQVDTCDNPPNGCSASYGYVLELKENNNTAGAITSGQTWHINLGWLNPLFLPSIFKSGP
jgi:hypothetical protein